MSGTGDAGDGSFPSAASGSSGTGGFVECVPNVSEGRDRGTIDAVAAAFDSVPGARLLHVDPNPDANRTVYTFAGRAEAALEAAFAGAAAAFERIDMRKQSGAHPRIGALDVVPFVPLSGSSIAECDSLARRFAAGLAGRWNLPVYLYADSARDPAHRELSSLRKGGYEGLAEFLLTGEGAPDRGPRFLGEGAAAGPGGGMRLGATATGARGFLVAWNVNLGPGELDLAKRIAAEIRSSGGGGRRFRSGLKAIGWEMPGFSRAQVSCNVTDFRAAPLLAIYRLVDSLAREAGSRARGSELVGLVPEAALDPATLREIGLDSLSPFDPGTRVIERALERAGLSRS